ncbi:MAG TPA: GNAT family N-acetyltransferase [Hyphomicrobiaceae bacterium]|nr:GNAT family N-acetyltransferase [Hyphomicrobiaceae bacterium]
MSAWVMRKAESNDAEALSILLAAAYSELVSRIKDIPTMTAADCLADITTNEVWIAETSGAIAGVLVVVPQDGFMQLANVAVHPNYRGAGLGRALMQHLEFEARRQDFSELRLTTHVDIPENIRLYEHLGWERVDENDNKVLMRKTLRGAS